MPHVAEITEARYNHGIPSEEASVSDEKRELRKVSMNFFDDLLVRLDALKDDLPEDRSALINQAVEAALPFFEAEADRVRRARSGPGALAARIKQGLKTE